MRRMRIYRPPTGVAVFEVEKDKDVALIDLFISGAKTVRANPKKYNRQYEVIYSTLTNLGVLLSDIVREDRIVLRFRKRIILCSLHMDGRGIVKQAVLASFAPGVLSRLAERLTRAGWRQITLIELKPASRARI